MHEIITVTTACVVPLCMRCAIVHVSIRYEKGFEKNQVEIGSKKLEDMFADMCLLNGSV